MRRIILCFISFLICWHCYAQLVFKKFVPSTYTPQTTDYSILQRSLERIEQRRIELKTSLTSYAHYVQKQLPRFRHLKVYGSKITVIRYAIK